ncbi:hypothetical protein BDR03DRAFT_241689 [Suillus americanus]|nr:hypothetical protein BDR03DRAFT_241689 [Suillus americanus]
MAPRRQAAPEGSMPPPSRPSSPGGEEIEETPFFDNVDELQQHGINVQDILKLKVFTQYMRNFYQTYGGPRAPPSILCLVS